LRFALRNTLRSFVLRFALCEFFFSQNHSQKPFAKKREEKKEEKKEKNEKKFK